MSGKRLLQDDYELLEELGRGGFGVVHRARHRQTGELVAVKLWRQDPTPDLLARLEREVRLVRGLRHPGLVEFRDLVWDEDGRPVLVYQLVEGKDLAHLLAAGPIPVAQALDWLEEVAGALDALHRQGLLHRDVKPGNILIGSRGHAYLVDYGLLRPDHQGETLTATGILVGTPEYLAPECLGRDPLDHRADLYSLGCLAYHLLAGAPPYQGAVLEVVRAHARAPLPPLPAPLEERYPDLSSAFEHCLAKLPAHRPASGAALVALLRQVTRESPPESAGKGPSLAATVQLEERIDPTPTPHPARANRGRGIPILVGVVLCLAAGFWMGDGRPGPSRPSQVPLPQDPSPEALRDLTELTEILLGELAQARDRWVNERGELLPRDAPLEGQGAEPLLSPQARFHAIQSRQLPSLTLFFLRCQQLTFSELQDPEIQDLLEQASEHLERSGIPPILAPTLEYARRPRAPRNFVSDLDPGFLWFPPFQTLQESLPEVSGSLRVVLESLKEARWGLDKLREEYLVRQEAILPEKALQTVPRQNLGGFLRANGAVPENQHSLQALVEPLGREFQIVLRALPSALAECPDEACQRCLVILVQRILAFNRELGVSLLLPLEAKATTGLPWDDPRFGPIRLEVLNILARLQRDWLLHFDAIGEERDRVLREELERPLPEDPSVVQLDRKVQAMVERIDELLDQHRVEATFDLVEAAPFPILGPLPLAVTKVLFLFEYSLTMAPQAWSEAHRTRLLALVEKALESFDEGPATPGDKAIYLRELPQQLGHLATLDPPRWQRLLQRLDQLGKRVGGRR